MRFSLIARALTSWIAVLAVLMAAVAPAISHALGPQHPTAWTEVCSSTGTKWVQSERTAGESPVPPADAHVLEHCPYCSLHASAIALPPALAASPLGAGFAHEVPLAFLTAPRTLFAWVRAQPRAPPQFS